MTSTTIQTLPPELLLTIFTMNSVMARREEVSSKFLPWKDNEIYVTHRTSQTCRAWRSLMLNSPQIWANCVDIDVFKNRKGYQDHVIKQLGQAPISIRGHIDVSPGPEVPFVQFLSSLFNGNWSRICSFDIMILCHSSETNNSFWEFLSRSNPVLHTFIVEVHGVIPIGFTEIDKRIPLFSGDAPCLKTFQWILPPSHPTKLQWFPQVHELGCKLPIGPAPITLPATHLSRRISALWDSIRSIKHLTSLQLVNCIQDFQDLPSKGIDLRNLQYLEVACELQQCLSLLDNVVIHPSICLNLTTTSHPLFKARIEMIALIFSHLTASFILSWPTPKHMSVKLTTTEFLLSFNPVVLHNRQFKIRLKMSSTCPMAFFLSVIPFEVLGELESLDLIISKTVQLDEGTKALCHTLFSKLGSVARFEASPEVLKLVNTSDQETTPLPKLKYLKVLTEGLGYYFTTQDIAYCSTFLIRREKMALLPIETLDLSIMGSKASMVDLSGQHGLKVIKSINGRLFEYVRGIQD